MFTTLPSLLEFLEIQDQTLFAKSSFPLLVPQRLANKMEKGNPHDPLLRQFVPLAQESRLQEGFCSDPVGDLVSMKSEGMLHKYKGRALLLTTNACAMHCRYCFRQHVNKTRFSKDLQHLREDSSIHEVILSGGDPLSLSNEKLGALIEELVSIPHLTRLRFHTRYPIGIPERIDAQFLELLEQCPLQIWFVIHCNHPKELDEDVLGSLKKVQELGIPVLNQAVLLRGINDTALTLCELSEVLGNAGIAFYYLHQLDRVEGAAHFEVSPDKGKALVEEMRTRLSGFMVPTYVQEVTGKPSKIPIV